MSKMTATMLFKVDPELKAEFKRVCKERGVSPSAVLRQMMQEYVKAKADQ